MPERLDFMVIDISETSFLSSLGFKYRKKWFLSRSRSAHTNVSHSSTYFVLLLQRGGTALMEAALHANYDTVEVLLKYGANTELQDKVSRVDGWVQYICRRLVWWAAYVRVSRVRILLLGVKGELNHLRLYASLVVALFIITAIDSRGRS